MKSSGQAQARRRSVVPEDEQDHIDDREHRFEQLFERYARPVGSFFLSRGFSREESRDLTQETFLGVYRGMERFRSESSVETWLFTIAANVWRNELRSRSARKREGQELSLDRTASEDGGLAASSELRQETDLLGDIVLRESAGRLREALSGLPDQMRRCLLLRIDQKLKYREIASVMQISIQTVKSQLFQAKERLRRELAAYYPELEENGDL